MSEVEPFIFKVLRRLGLWTIICTISAAPSFSFGQFDYDESAMVTGVVLFILAYTAVTCTPWFEWFHDRRYIRKTLYLGYGLRLVLSVGFPIGMMLDVPSGMMSVGFVESLGIDVQTFGGTLLATIVQGTILNIVIFVFMVMVYATLSIRGIPEVERDKQRGFEVMPVVQPAQTIAEKNDDRA